MKYDVAIAHRVCPVLAGSAAGFSDKFAMVKATTASLAAAMRGLRVKLVVILDGCPIEYERLFDDTFSDIGDNYSRTSTNSIGNKATYAKQVEILSSYTKDAKYLYFSEDDYLYREYALAAMADFLDRPGVDFVTPLDHPDRYSISFPQSKKSEIRVSRFCHWREVGSTCCTFMVKSETFLKTVARLSAYSRGVTDTSTWLGLTKDRVFSPSANIGAIFTCLYRLIRYRRKEYNLWVPATWYYHKWRLLFWRRYRLWGPMPTLAVHLCGPSLPPISIVNQSIAEGSGAVLSAL